MVAKVVRVGGGKLVLRNNILWRHVTLPHTFKQEGDTRLKTPVGLEKINARPDRDSHVSVNSILIPDLKKEKSKRKKPLM